MRTTVQELADDDAGSSGPAEPFFGARWALTLGSTLLILLSLVTGMRWLSLPVVQGREQIIQRSIPMDAALTSTRPDPTAPDPGDNLP